MIVLGIIASTLRVAFIVTFVVAKFKMGDSVNENKPEQKNALEGKIVIFIENEVEPKNADGVRDHLEAVGDNYYVLGFYEKYVNRAVDIVFFRRPCSSESGTGMHCNSNQN